ncbi:MAG: hypothetical protein P0S95_06260 [Rhabdochlamydiaceae bacterium]|nr:hypothetical protein [Candidatus Amphrikana amoebophyrae]
MGSYEDLSRKTKPGLRPNLFISGYSILGTYFSLLNQDLTTNFGLDSSQDFTSRNMLTWNIEVSRNISGGLIRYFLPMLVIICILFSVLALIVNWNKRNSQSDDPYIAYKSIAIYTALIFALIIIHSGLRTHHDSDEIFFIEFLFFINYFTLVLLVFYSWILQMFPQEGSFPRKISPILLIMFWPLQFGAWFIMTYLVFFFN